jgi:hypothetical protein
MAKDAMLEVLHTGPAAAAQVQYHTVQEQVAEHLVQAD